MFIQNFTCFSTSIFLSKNRQGNVNSFCIVQFSRSFLNFVVVISFRRLCYYITSFRVCQEVFQNLFLNFSWFFRFRRDLGSFSLAFRKLIYYIISFQVCQEAFSKFIFEFLFKLFKIRFNRLSFLLKQLIYYITLFLICQEVFQSFLNFFLISDHLVVFLSCSRDSFYIILSLLEKVNTFFKNNLKNIAQLVFRVLHKIYFSEYRK